MIPALLTVAEAAAVLRCSRRRVFELLADETLLRGASYGRKTLILGSSVEAALAAPAPAPIRPRRRPARKELITSLEAALAKARSKPDRSRARVSRVAESS